MNNKIYNNLTIANLVKTDWFNQFNEEQQREINLGLVKYLNISIYAKKEFDEYQMKQIRRGLENKINISIYAKECFNSAQMFIIRIDL